MGENLGEWRNRLTVQDQVIAYMDSIGSPLLLREVYRPLGLPREHVNRVLARLHAKDVLTRWKIPVAMPRPGRRNQEADRGGATRRCFLYEFASGFAHKHWQSPEPWQ